VVLLDVLWRMRIDVAGVSGVAARHPELCGELQDATRNFLWIAHSSTHS